MEILPRAENCLICVILAYMSRAMSIALIRTESALWTRVACSTVLRRPFFSLICLTNSRFTKTKKTPRNFHLIHIIEYSLNLIWKSQMKCRFQSCYFPFDYWQFNWLIAKFIISIQLAEIGTRAQRHKHWHRHSANGVQLQLTDWFEFYAKLTKLPIIHAAPRILHRNAIW